MVCLVFICLGNIFIFFYRIYFMKRGQVRVDHPIVQKKIDKSLDLSVKEGAITSVSTNLSLSYFAPAALALGASNVQMGILHAVINLLPNIAQLKATSLLEKWNRKKITLFGVMGKILIVLPLLLIGYLHWIGLPHMVWAFIGLVGLHYVFGAIAHPAWFSWMGSLVPEEKRGSYFSRRNRAIGFLGIVAMVAGALILDGVKKYGIGGDVIGFTLLGFGILFVLSGWFRLWAWGLLRKQYEPRLKIRKKDHFSFSDFIRHCRETPFGRFSLFAAAFAFCVGISTPYWAVYMLHDLNFSYMWYMAITVSTVIFQMIFLPLLGKFGDKFGNVKLIKTCSLIAALVPFVWVASVLIGSDLGVKVYLLTAVCLVDGFAWAGYGLALNNYVYDAISSRSNGFGLSYMNLLIGVGGFVGAGVGALLAWANVSFMNPLLFIFVVSGVGRFAVALYGSRFLHEVRNVKRFSSQFWVQEFAPARGIVKEIHDLRHLVEKVEYYVTPEDRKKFGEIDYS